MERMKEKQKRKPLILLENVGKTYFLGDEVVRAVSDVNLKIYQKEFVSIIGPSGCGKSTLMHLIGLLDSPTSGKIILDGMEVSHLSDERLSKLRNEYVGFVFQQFNLINKFTVLENVLLPVRYAKGYSLQKGKADKAKRLLETFGIWERRNFFPNKISGGQQQRTAIARALIMDPKIILADEPTGNVDSKTGKEILNLLELLNRDFETTVVIVTHDRMVADRTKREIYMSDGKVVNKLRWK
jgi:putative ABC transport system ATP-binding protein